MPLPHVNPQTLLPGQAFAYGDFVFLLGGSQGPQPMGDGLLEIVAVDTVKPGLPYQALAILADDVFPVPVLKASVGDEVYTYGILCPVDDGHSRIFKVVIQPDGTDTNKLAAFHVPIIVSGSPSDEDKAELNRVFRDTPPIEDGDIVVINSEAYTARVYGQAWPCAEFIRGIVL